MGAKSQALGLYLPFSCSYPPGGAPGRGWGSRSAVGSRLSVGPGLLQKKGLFSVSAALGPAPQREDSVYMGQEAGGPYQEADLLKRLLGKQKTEAAAKPTKELLTQSISGGKEEEN